MGLVFIGIMSIYAVDFQNRAGEEIFFLFSNHAMKQGLFLVISIIMGCLMLLVDSRLFLGLSYIGYLSTLFLMLGTSILGMTIGGHNAWYKLGMFYLQPAEFAKVGCALAVARYLGNMNTNLAKLSTQFILLIIVAVPAALVVFQQGDAGSGLVFASFFLIFFREGLPNRWVLMVMIPAVVAILAFLVPLLYVVVAILGIACIMLGVMERTIRRVTILVAATVGLLALVEGVDFFMHRVLKPHQRIRIKMLVDPSLDPRGAGWNVTQSKIAIGSGGIWGKGFLKGTQTRYGFVPEQRTDFIFCTIGEEHGWLGTSLVILLFLGLLLRILTIAERQKSRFVRTYAYAVFAIIVFHFVVNVGMTIGLMPVIGIPLPFITYGGSCFLSFSGMLFLLLKFDAERKYAVV